jgi:hypothetical protein
MSPIDVIAQPIISEPVPETHYVNHISSSWNTNDYIKSHIDDCTHFVTISEGSNLITIFYKHNINNELSRHDSIISDNGSILTRFKPNIPYFSDSDEETDDSQY